MQQTTLVILAHPDIEKSFANKLIVESLEQQNAIVRDISKLYPDYKIDVKAEQTLLSNADIIIFQYPLFWYNVPAILKSWIDSVFTYGFAFGKDHFQLEGKKVIVSFTAGSSSKNYPEEVIEKIIFPIKGLAEYCKMNYCGEVFSHEMATFSEEAKNKTITNAKNHSQQLFELIS